MHGFSGGKDSRMKETGMQALGKVKMKSLKETSLGVAQALFDTILKHRMVTFWVYELLEWLQCSLDRHLVLRCPDVNILIKQLFQ